MTYKYIEISSGGKIYLKNSLLHRLDGPAIEESDGESFWFYQDTFIPVDSQKEFEDFLNMDISKMKDFLK